MRLNRNQETSMEEDFAKRIAAHPRYQELKAKRTILLVAFNKPLLSQKLGNGVTTLGMPIGVAVIVFTIIITWIYIRRANSEFDSLTEQIVKGVVK
jgi:uncharacterized membrane protein (DUF485 family)